MASKTEVVFHAVDCKNKQVQWRTNHETRTIQSGKQKRQHLRTAIVPSWQWCQSIRLTGKGGILQKGLDWKRRKRQARKETTPTLQEEKQKLQPNVFQKVQFLITDFPIVSTQSIAKRMLVRNFELCSFPRPVVLLHEPCGSRREAKYLVDHVITRTHNAGSIVVIAKLACSLHKLHLPRGKCNSCWDSLDVAWL